jgi:hypothetical protein
MPNAGAAFSNAFNQGMQQNALAGFAQNPNDPRAQGAAARYDPGAVMQYRLQAEKQKMVTEQGQHEEWLKYAGSLAKWADTPEKWDQAVDYMVSHGHAEAAQLKGKFSPALRANFMALGGVQDDKPQNPQLIPFQAGGGVLMRDPQTGAVQQLVIPNDGSQPAGAPVNNGQPLTDDQMRQLLNGGQTGSAPSGGFR